MNNSQTPHTLRFRWIGIFLLCEFLIASAGYFFFDYIKTSEKVGTNKTLASVGQLKSGQIQAYLAERKGDAAVVSSFLKAPLAQHWLERQDINAPDALSQLTESVITAHQYRELLLLDASANIRFDIGHGGMLSEAGKATALRAMRERTQVSFKIYFGDPSAPGVPLLDTFVPVMNADGSRAVGMVVLRNELNILFSLLQTWPVESETAESLLVTKDGSDVLFLNELRHKKGTALKLRVPLSSDTNSPAWPAISAVTGHFGLFEANDYRGEHILAYTIAVPDTPWGMVVKMDVAEATERSRTLQKITAMVIIAIVALLGIIAWIGWRKFKADLLAKKLLEESQHRLLQSEKMLNEAQQLVHLGGWERNFVTGSLTCSEEIFRILEIDPAHTDISYDEFILTVHPEDREAVDQAYLTCIRTREPFDIAHRLLLADGRVKWVNEHGTFFYDSKDVPLRSIGTIQDITERKQAEALTQQFGRLLHDSFNEIYLFDADTLYFTQVSEGAKKNLGYSTDELKHLTPLDLKPSFTRESFEQMVAPLRNGERESLHFEAVYRRKDGTTYPVEISLQLTAPTTTTTTTTTTTFLAIVQDITERKRAEDALRISAVKQQLLFESSRDALMLLAPPSWKFTGANQATLQLFGASSMAEFTALGPWNVSPERQSDGRPSSEKAQEMIAIAMREGSCFFEWEHQRLDGLMFPSDVLLTRMNVGEDVFLQASVRDITRRKQVENALRKSEDQFRSTFNQAAVGIAHASLDGSFQLLNEKFCEIVGYSYDELLHMSFQDITFPADLEDNIRYFQQLLAGEISTFTMEKRYVRKDRNLIWVSLTVSLLRDADGTPKYTIGVIEDITARKQAEEELRDTNDKLEAINRQLSDTQNLLLQSDKMASVGQLAAGVAHEINNPIGYVGSNLGTLDEYLKELFGLVAAYEEMEHAVADDAALARIKAVKNKIDLGFLKEDVLSLMRESQEGIIRVRKIVQDLKDFSRLDSGDEWHRADLHKGLDSTLNVANNEIKYKTDVKKEYGDIAEVECVISQLNQVFMNLLVNAAHAIEEHGTITLRTGQQGDEVWVEVADTGNGIAPEHINKIFDPFFTTKPVGKGTGLGLSLSYGIIQKHHGRIEVNSEVGKGASFKVWLPVNQPQDDDTAAGRVSAA